MRAPALQREGGVGSRRVLVGAAGLASRPDARRRARSNPRTGHHAPMDRSRSSTISAEDAGVARMNPKNGPKSRVATKPVM